MTAWLWNDVALFFGRLWLAGIALVAAVIVASVIADVFLPPPSPHPLDERQTRNLLDRHERTHP